MIVSYETDPDPAFRRYLDRLEVDCKFEETESGLAYLVTDHLYAPESVVGTIKTSPEEVDVELYLSSALDKGMRKLVAQACFDAQEWSDPNNVARACDAIATAVDEPTRQTFISTVRQNLEAHRLGFRAMDQRRERIHPQTRAQFRSTLGWVAIRRPLDERGQEAFDSLEKVGLCIPMIEDGSLVATSKDPRTPGLQLDIKGMVEKSHRHRCKCCSGEIPKSTIRITVSQDKAINGYDHHHFHPNCFIDDELPKVNLATARLMPAVDTIGQSTEV